MSVTLETAEWWIRYTAEHGGQSDTEQALRLIVAELDEQRGRVTAVLELHRAERWPSRTAGRPPTRCEVCTDSSEEPLPWPCPTALAAGAAA